MATGTKHGTKHDVFWWVGTLYPFKFFQPVDDAKSFLIMRPTSEGKICDQEAALQWTFHILSALDLCSVTLLLQQLGIM